MVLSPGARGSAMHEMMVSAFYCPFFSLVSTAVPSQQPSSTDRICDLHAAIVRNDVAFAERYVSSEKCDVNQTDSSGSTPLFMASGMGRAQIVRALLARDGIDVNKHNADNLTPLMVASHQGYAEVVSLLLSHPNIDINKSPDGVGTSALAMANGGKLDESNVGEHSKVVQLLKEAGAVQECCVQ